MTAKPSIGRCRFKPPRARWPFSADTPPDEWDGHYALPLADSVTGLPAVTSKDRLTVELAAWDYSEVADILHVGSYDAEAPTIEALRTFIAANGDEIVCPRALRYSIIESDK